METLFAANVVRLFTLNKKGDPQEIPSRPEFSVGEEYSVETFRFSVVLPREVTDFLTEGRSIRIVEITLDEVIVQRIDVPSWGVSVDSRLFQILVEQKELELERPVVLSET